MSKEFYEAKATQYRDMATIVSVIFGFLVATILFSFNSNVLANALILSIEIGVAIIMGFVLVALSWLLFDCDKKASEAARPKAVQ